MNHTPCANLIERDGGSCILPDREFPTDCPECSAYLPGLHASERQRCEVWSRGSRDLALVEAEKRLAEITAARKERASRLQFLEGAGHD